MSGSTSSRIFLVGVAAAVSLAGVVFPGAAFPSGRDGGVAPGTLSNLRVCPYEGFSRSQGRCTKDFRGRTLKSNRFVCSVDVSLRQPARLHDRMTYGGQIQYASTRLLSPGVTRWWISTDIFLSHPLPGGAWGCAFSVGARRLAAVFESGGPSGPVVDLTVCSAKTAIDSVCPSDQSESISSTDSVVCNAVFVGQRGKLASIDLLSGGAELFTSQGYVVGAPVWIAYQEFISPSGSGVGDYACGFSVNGTRLAEKPFKVLSG
jgi:hypothetical protein